MKRQKVILFVIAAALIVGTAGALVRIKASQTLGKPGLRTAAIPGSQNLSIELPVNVLDYSSTNVPEDSVVTNGLPHDTSFGQRLYTAPDGFQILVNVVLMGSDRTSIHKPQFCLVGSGWRIDQTESAAVPIPGPRAYELPVMKLTTSREFVMNGQRTPMRGIYCYWFVADEAVTRDHWERMWWMGRTLLTTGVLQRWAYITCFAYCPPGAEAAAYDRMKQFMAVAVPEFQIATPGAASAQTVVGQARGAGAAGR